MLEGPLLLATFGLAFNLFLWGIPGMIGAAGIAHALFPASTPTLAESLGTLERNAGVTPSLPDALVQLIGAEVEAMHVAGDGLQQPTPEDLVPRANHASGRVLDAVQVYIQAARAITR